MEQIAPDDPSEALILLWGFMGLATPVFERCDDSSGTVIEIFCPSSHVISGLEYHITSVGSTYSPSGFRAIAHPSGWISSASGVPATIDRSMTPQRSPLPTGIRKIALGKNRIPVRPHRISVIGIATVAAEMLRVFGKLVSVEFDAKTWALWQGDRAVLIAKGATLNDVIRQVVIMRIRCKADVGQCGTQMQHRS